MTYTIFSDRTDKLLSAAGAIVVALLVLRALSLAIMRLEGRRADGERQLVRLRRGETAAALVATAIPYVAAIAVIILLASAFLPRTAAALGGSALVLILVGFGGQRFLTDVIAGALIAFERWYGVGDFVMVEPAQASGLVEQFGFRSTVLRSLNGDRTYIPNSPDRRSDAQPARLSALLDRAAHQRPGRGTTDDRTRRPSRSGW
jgi:small-conductance mechanosensitive channel